MQRACSTSFSRSYFYKLALCTWKVEEKKMIWRSSWGWNPSCFMQKEAPWSMRGCDWFLGFGSTRRCRFTASLSVSHLSSREEIINLSELLLTWACVSAVETCIHRHSSTQVRNMCNMHAHMCMQANTACTPAINGAITVSPHLLLRRKWESGQSSRVWSRARELQIEVIEEQKYWPTNKARPLFSFIPSRIFWQYRFCNITCVAYAYKLPYRHTVNTYAQKHKPRTHQELTA